MLLKLLSFILYNSTLILFQVIKILSKLVYFKMKKIFFLLFFILSANLYAKVDYFRLYGDVFSFLPAFAGIYTLIEQDYEGLAYLAISTASTLATTFVIKYSFVGISKKNPNLARISRRPNGKDYEGFPSGHTSSAFSAAGFMQKRYGYKWGIPTTILATLVGISRITSKKHTTLQVLAGAALGYSMSYFITKQRDDMNILIDIEQREAKNGFKQQYYGLSFNMVF